MCFRHILQIVYEHEAASYLELTMGDHWSIHHGEAQEDLPVNVLPVSMQESVFGELRWQSVNARASTPLLQSVATIMGRGFYFNQAQKQHQQLILMEERATIAMELHDSLARCFLICVFNWHCSNEQCPRTTHPPRPSSPIFPVP